MCYLLRTVMSFSMNEPYPPQILRTTRMTWSARAALLFTLLLALGARAAPAGEPDRDRRGVTLRADLHPGLLVFGPAATVVLARDGEEEGMAGVSLLGKREAVMGRGTTGKDGSATEVRQSLLLWGKAVLIGVGVGEGGRRR